MIQIFISHSSQDRDLLNSIDRALSDVNVKAYFAERELAARNPADKIVDAIRKSDAVFLVMTSRVTDRRDTRDWVLFEVGAAKALKRPIYGWKSHYASEPEPVKQVTDYASFDYQSERSKQEMVDAMKKIAKDLGKEK